MEIPFIDHDYRLTRMDRLFASLRKALENQVEFRHDSYRHFARFAPLIGGRPNLNPDLRRIVNFPDHSNALYFGNPIVLAAGANKTAIRISDYANTGFGGVTVGTATRKMRIGNTHRPRVGFSEADRIIHNSMGLNNDGIDVIARRVDEQLVKAHNKGLCVGLSVAETPGLQDEGERLDDIIETFRKAYKVADYVEVNVSCPNTGEERHDLDTCFMERTFSEIMKHRASLALRKAVYAKLSPDLTERQLLSVLDVLTGLGVNGVILGNTFPSVKGGSLGLHTPVSSLQVLTSDGARGGISGRPLYRNTFWAVGYVKNRYPDLSVVACGGIDHGAKVWDLLNMGADFVQAYSVVAFRWMAAHAMNAELLACMRSAGYVSLEQFSGIKTTGQFRTLS
jgi:dihydroorotate dehydrogenase